MPPISETFRLVSTFLFPYCIVLYRRPRNCKSTSTLPTSRLATLVQWCTPQMYLSIAQLSLRSQAKTSRNVLPLITDNESNIDVILNRLTSSPMLPSSPRLGPRRAVVTATLIFIIKSHFLPPRILLPISLSSLRKTPAWIITCTSANKTRQSVESDILTVCAVKSRWSDSFCNISGNVRGNV